MVVEAAVSSLKWVFYGKNGVFLPLIGLLSGRRWILSCRGGLEPVDGATECFSPYLEEGYTHPKVDVKIVVESSWKWKDRDGPVI